MKYDLTVIGSGPGGYIAAIRAAQLGMKTAIIEKDKSLGGTCLNVGCIPSKSLLDSSEHFYNARATFQTHGIDLEGLSVNMPQMIKRKQEVVDTVVGGVDFLMKKNNIDVHKGYGSFITKNKIKVTAEDGKESEVETDKVIIATGSVPGLLPFIEFDGKRVITSTEALELTEVPKKMVVVGGGVIGLELGSVFARLGTEVSVVEYMDRLIPGMDSTMAKEIQKVMKKHLKVKFYLSHKVTGADVSKDGVVLKAENKKGKEVSFEADYCLLSVGRKPYTDKLGLENIGLDTDERGRIPVDEHLQTKVEGVYAIGDVIRGAMLAHKAEEEGVMAAEIIAEQKPHINYLLIPNVIYTWPEVAGVGYTEEQLKEKGRKYNTGSFPFRGLGRARASMDIDGVVKVLADKETDELLGVHIIGARAADMIAEAVVAMEYRASAEDISRMSHAHPTYMEAVKEACLDATGKRALNM